jgi:hypothetical protein
MDIWHSSISDKEMTLLDSEFTNSVAQAMCAKVVEGEGGVVAEATRGARRAAIDAQVARLGSDPGHLPHALFNWRRALGLGGGTVGEGQCRLCLNKHALGVCTGKTCSESKALDTDRDHPKPSSSGCAAIPGNMAASATVSI